MSNAMELTHTVTSAEVVKKLIELGYLKETNWQKASAIDVALERLQEDLCRNQTIRTTAASVFVDSVIGKPSLVMRGSDFASRGNKFQRL